jgi:hypothetical protein
MLHRTFGNRINNKWRYAQEEGDLRDTEQDGRVGTQSWSFPAGRTCPLGWHVSPSRLCLQGKPNFLSRCGNGGKRAKRLIWKEIKISKVGTFTVSRLIHFIQEFRKGRTGTLPLRPFSISHPREEGKIMRDTELTGKEPSGKTLAVDLHRPSHTESPDLTPANRDFRT